MRNWPVYLLVLLAAVGALLLLLSESEPARTARGMAQAICPTPGDALGRDVLEQHLGGRIEVVVADAEQSTFERAELIERLVELRAAYPSCYLDLLQVEVSEGGQASLALVTGELEYSESEASDLHAARRLFEATFRSSGKSYRLERIELGPLRRTPPEARP
ncbi:MAG: hypothetical protein ABW217_01470 [Polyangiaceae bacterium]